MKKIIDAMGGTVGITLISILIGLCIAKMVEVGPYKKKLHKNPFSLKGVDVPEEINTISKDPDEPTHMDAYIHGDTLYLRFPPNNNRNIKPEPVIRSI